MVHDLRHNANFFLGWVCLLQRNAERVLHLSALISQHLGLGKDLESCQGPPWRRPSQLLLHALSASSAADPARQL